jgi:3-phenylpropionate/trans-cinnamate dioxygenase ferredoxin subunit
MAWHVVADADAIGEDESLSVDVAGVPVALCRSGGGLHAVHNVCTHEFAMLTDGWVEEGCIECPLHQARFDLRTGEALTAPAVEPIKVYPLKVEGGKVLVDL